MKVEIKVPQAGESVTEAMISEWFVESGDAVEKDEAILELETDKANMELNAEEAGVVHIDVPAGEVVSVGQTLGYIDTDASADDEDGGDEAAKETAEGEEKETEEGAADAEKKRSDKAEKEQANAGESQEKSGDGKNEPILSPAARRVVEEEDLDPAGIDGSGKDGRIIKEDALKAAKAKSRDDQRQSEKPAESKATPEREKPPAKVVDMPVSPKPVGERGERVAPMSMLRRRIAQRLVEAQQNAAILTTYNEIDMTEVMAARAKYKDAFEKRHGVRLGFMSFFIKACVAALQEVPEINAMIDEHNIVYRDYCDIGVAVGTDRGLLVPIIRDCERLSFAQIEKAIADYAVKARDGKISLDDLSGGTFTISNGGVYGSLLSSPILNPPQSGILGMHKIEKRPVVVDDQIVIRPMMYVALSYDHRIVDGKGAVTFLVKIKERLEDPARLLLEI